MDEEYWETIENEAEISEAAGFDYVDEYINAGYAWTLSRIISNQDGGKKSSAE